MDQSERHHLLSRLMWDYNYTAEEVDEVLLGRKSTLGHLTQESIVRRILETYSWFTVIRLIPPQELYPILNEDFKKNLRSKSLQKHYAFVRNRLQQAL